MGKTYGAIIATHQARIRCLMYKLGVGIIPEVKSQKKVEFTDDSDLEEPLIENNNQAYRYGNEILGGAASRPGQVASFMNGAVIRVTISKYNILVSLVYSGELDSSEDKAGYTYFVTKNEIGGTSHKYSKMEFPDSNVDNKLYKVDGDNKYIFYLVRHGQASHNVLKGLSKMVSSKDTSLTDIGKQQARETGDHLSQEINHNNFDRPLILFGSDLKRTRQTLSYIIKQFPQDVSSKFNYINILPCAHELAYRTSENENCDANQGKWPTPNENTTTCLPDTCKSDGELANNWTEYSEFYGNATRSTRSWLPKKCLTCIREPASGKRCRDTDMIIEAINMINKIDNQSEHLSRSGESSHNHSRDTLDFASRFSFTDDESDDDEDLRKTLVTNPVDKYSNNYDNDELRETLVTNPVDKYRKGGKRVRRTRVRRASKKHREHSRKKKVQHKKKTRRIKKNKKTHKLRRKQ